jgi:hypothetical protein
VGGIAHIPMTVQMAGPGETNFTGSNELFAYAFGAVLLFWALGQSVGAILSLIRRGS